MDIESLIKGTDKHVSGVLDRSLLPKNRSLLRMSQVHLSVLDRSLLPKKGSRLTSRTVRGLLSACIRRLGTRTT